MNEKVDLVEVVRCRDCRFWVIDSESCLVRSGAWEEADNYCNYGERRENELEK